MGSPKSDTDMVVCPYNSAHRMLRKRLQPHLIKCRVNYPDVELQKCPFNQTHLIPEPEFVFHVTNCTDRKLITQYKYAAPNTHVEDKIEQKPVESEENWDDTEVNDYNPQNYLEKSAVLRKPEGVQPAQRKAFIKQERKRLGDDSDDESEEKCVKKFMLDNDDSDNQMPEAPPPPTIKNWHENARSRSRSPVYNHAEPFFRQERKFIGNRRRSFHSNNGSMGAYGNTSHTQVDNLTSRGRGERNFRRPNYDPSFNPSYGNYPSGTHYGHSNP